MNHQRGTWATCCVVWLVGLGGVFAAGAGWAEEADPATAPVRRYEFGLVLQAQGGSFRNVCGTVTVPVDWPGQQRVRVVKEDLPAGVTVAYKKIEEVGRQMLVRFPVLRAGEEARAVVTFDVERLPPVPMPQDTQRFSVPDRSRQTAPYLSPSPRIESNHPEVLKAAKEALGDRQGVWEQVRAIHEWVYRSVRFSGEFENTQGVVETLACRRGVCAEKNSLAVAMLRAIGIPARLVRIPGHCYYEVCLRDGEGQTHWFSGDASAEARIVPDGGARGLILQKGDSVPVIDPSTKKRSQGRFLGETVTGLPQARGVELKTRFISPAVDAKPVVPKP
mgnify:CR=1 FL=1